MAEAPTLEGSTGFVATPDYGSTIRMSLDEFVRVFHVACGGLSLALGFCALAARKGGAWHRLFGRVYVASMLATCVSALWLALEVRSLFLGALSIFTAYLAFSGFRVVRLRSATDRRPGMVDWLLTVSLIGASLVLASQSFDTFDEGLRIRVVPLVFAAIGMILSILDLVRFLQKDERLIGLPRHVIHMLSSFIAAWTAFSVINFTFVPLSGGGSGRPLSGRP